MATVTTPAVPEDAILGPHELFGCREFFLEQGFSISLQDTGEQIAEGPSLDSQENRKQAHVEKREPGTQPQWTVHTSTGSVFSGDSSR